MKLRILSLVALVLPLAARAADPAPVFDFSKLKLVQYIDCSANPPSNDFREFPADASKVETILGKKCRVLANDNDQVKYFAYNIGRNKGLKPGAAYVLVVEYPEDKPRTMFFLNRGNETGRGVSTGNAVPDAVFGLYVNNNPESIKYPLSNKYEVWQNFFYLHDRFPEFESLRGEAERKAKPSDGFWVVVAQMNQDDAVGSAGAAASGIYLYEVSNPESYNVKINYPPEDLPKRYIFCREEMADGVISVPHGADHPQNRGVNKPVDWHEYKARNMMFLGMNTFTRDLLEFGHNQGWDAKDDSWYVGSSTPKLWGDTIKMLEKYPGLYVLPYYEYGGGTGPKGVGGQKKPEMLGGGKDYLPPALAWLNKNAHIDVADPEALEDAKRLLDRTVLDFKDDKKFVGAWFRARPVQIPMSFSDDTLASYKSETGTEVTRQGLKADRGALEKYYAWWFKKREGFFAELAKYLREKGVPGAVVLFTCDPSEPGAALPGNVLVTDDTATWSAIMAQQPKKKAVVSIDSVVASKAHPKAQETPHDNYENWEWDHAMPWADPQNYDGKDGVVMTYTFNRLYTVSSPGLFEDFKNTSGLAAVRHHSLNENIMNNKLGYFASDVEPSGPYSMLAEARAVAYGDPRFLGYLISNTLARGFPQYVREFDRAFLALPALPSAILTDGASDSEVVVRTIDAGAKGTYLAVVNTGLNPKKGVTINLPKDGALTNAATATPLTANGGKLALDFYPGQLYALLIK